MSKVRVRLREKRHIYIHNDIANAAFHFKKRILDRLETGDREGITLDVMAGLTMLAFAVEARINFVGIKRVKDWKERRPYLEKTETVCASLGINPDWKVRPLSSIRALVEFRNLLAHGKPQEHYKEEEVVITDEEINDRKMLIPEWQDYATEQNFLDTYDDAEAFWHELINKAGLRIFDTITSGESSIDFIERIDE
ncbi:hypothetical protein ACCT14_11445 [Rhizobium brockwellii]|uniref:hypothetical protein n=1 Tax=Rhizobium TaxID=379 RepID=UPI0010313EB7|nr:hypothetical protein [Rhizobium leguminosarum]TAX33019.1 hypothetical protein ELI06_01205 [Rhizobium leguminosarum]